MGSVHTAQNRRDIVEDQEKIPGASNVTPPGASNENAAAGGISVPAPQPVPPGYSPVAPQSSVPNGGVPQPGYPNGPQAGAMNNGFPQPGYPNGPQAGAMNNGFPQPGYPNGPQAGANEQRIPPARVSQRTSGGSKCNNLSLYRESLRLLPERPALPPISLWWRGTSFSLYV